MVDGITTYLMEKGIKFIIEYHITKDIFREEENMGKAIINGINPNIMTGNFIKTKFTGMEGILQNSSITQDILSMGRKMEVGS